VLHYVRLDWSFIEHPLIIEERMSTLDLSILIFPYALVAKTFFEPEWQTYTNQFFNAYRFL